jgi:hypothetical protein
MYLSIDSGEQLSTISVQCFFFFIISAMATTATIAEATAF